MECLAIWSNETFARISSEEKDYVGEGDRMGKKSKKKEKKEKVLERSISLTFKLPSE